MSRYISLEVVDQIIFHLFNSGEYQEPVETFKIVSLVNSMFLESARRHGSNYQDSICFYTGNRLQEYMSFVKEYPESTIPSRIIYLRMELFHDEPRHAVFESVISAFHTWEIYFPNVEDLDVSFDRFNVNYDIDSTPVENAMQKFMASPRLQCLRLEAAYLPADYFSKIGPSLKELALPLVEAREGYFLFPKTLDRLEITDGSLIREARSRDPELFPCIKELALRDDSYFNYDIWNFIYIVEDSLQKLTLEFHECACYPCSEVFHALNILQSDTLEVITVPLDLYPSPDKSIAFLSKILQMNGIRDYMPALTLRLEMKPNAFTDSANLAMLDKWVTEGVPMTMVLEVVLRVWERKPGDAIEWERSYREILENCGRRGTIKLEVFEMYIE